MSHKLKGGVSEGKSALNKVALAASGSESLEDSLENHLATCSQSDMHAKFTSLPGAEWANLAILPTPIYSSIKYSPVN